MPSEIRDLLWEDRVPEEGGQGRPGLGCGLQSIGNRGFSLSILLASKSCTWLK